MKALLGLVVSIVFILQFAAPEAERAADLLNQVASAIDQVNR